MFQGTGFGVQVNVPLPVTDVVTALGRCVKLAVMFLVDVTLVSTHVAPEQSPLKLLNEYPAPAVAVQVLLPP